jgi:hypothetical protein
VWTSRGLVTHYLLFVISLADRDACRLCDRWRSLSFVTFNGAQPALPTLLGLGPVCIPAGGKIRAGIKVLTKKAAEHPAAKEIYERGVAANHSFEAIEHAIAEAVPELKTPLIPKNVPWFTVRRMIFESGDRQRDPHGVRLIGSQRIGVIPRGRVQRRKSAAPYFAEALTRNVLDSSLVAPASGEDGLGFCASKFLSAASRTIG